MVVFIYRPSPQVPRPSVQAAIYCYDACQFNVYMTKRQIETKSVDITWIFVQAIFMCINTILWTLSYSDIRRVHSREEVEGHLEVAMESIRLCSERWPGVASAIQLYYNLIDACMKIYDKDGDVPIAAGSPSDTASVVSSNMVDGINRSRTTSPATASTTSVGTPSEKVSASFGFSPSQNHSPLNFASKQTNLPNGFAASPNGHPSSGQVQPPHTRPMQFSDMSPKAALDTNIPPFFNQVPTTQFSTLPTTFAELPQWNPTFSMPPRQEGFGMPTMPMNSSFYNEAYAANQGYEMADYLNPGWSQEARGNGLNHQQQSQLMQDFEMNESKTIEQMIQQSHQLFRPPQLQTF